MSPALTETFVTPKFIIFAGKRKEKGCSKSPPRKPCRAPRDRYVGIKPKPKNVGIDHGSKAHLFESTDELLWPSFHSAVGISNLDRQALIRTASIWKPSTTPQTIISKFETWVGTNGCKSSPLADHALKMVKFNVFRTLLSNSLTLGFPAEERMEDAALSPFTCFQGTGSTTALLPPNLRPTKLQCRVPHHPWIDLLPIPLMRDNLLPAGDSYNDLELCADLIGYYNSPTTRTGLIVWGEPWDPEAWEVTESFVRRWGWVMRGCKELVRSTNYWRLQRGEPSLEFDKDLFEEVS